MVPINEPINPEQIGFGPVWFHELMRAVVMLLPVPAWIRVGCGSFEVCCQVSRA